MSRLDSFIRRLQAQRACLNEAVAQIRGVEGFVLELGLGNGRTFDHLREICPDREIYVFDRDTDKDGVFDEAGQTSFSQVSLNDAGAQMTSGILSGSPLISDDGRFVAWVSNAKFVARFKAMGTSSERGALPLNTRNTM